MARFNPVTYDPKADSSKGHEKHRKDGFDGVVLIVGEGECPDGCGGKPNSKKRTFVQGHDARFKGILIRAASTGTKVRTVGPKGTTDKTALQIAGSFGFSDQVKSGSEGHQAKAKIRAAKAEARATAKDAVEEAKRTKATAKGDLVGEKRPVKVGRWTYEGTITAVNGKVATVEYEKKDGTVMETEMDLADLA